MFKNTFMLSILTAVALLITSHANAAYTTSESGYRGYQIGANFRDFAGATEMVAGDDVATEFVLPFAFIFYGQSYAAGSQGWVSTNGLLGFSTFNQSPYCCNATTSGEAPLNTIQAGWFDLIATVYAQTGGAPGNQEFVFTWSGEEYSAGSPNLFQAILHETSNDIEFQYSYLSSFGHSANVGGIRGDESSTGLNFVDASTVTLNDTGLLVSTNVPEPGSVALLGLGFAGFALSRRKTQRASIG